MPEPIFKRILLKISGEALAATQGFGVDTTRIHEVAAELAEVQNLGIQMAIVVGGGNFFRGVADQARNMDRVSADHMGMLATVINALALQDAIESHGRATRVMSAIGMDQVAEPYIRRRAVRHLEKGRVVIFAAGMGNPYFTTDTAGVQRAAEIEADMVLKGTHGGVDGVYSEDPRKNVAATKYDVISFDDVITRNLRVMDMTAITFCKDNRIPIRVFDLMAGGNLERALDGDAVGTLVN